MNAHSSPPVHRLDYLDAVRACALMLGVLFHASLSFMPVFIGWAVMDISTSPLVQVFSLVSHSFRMALFFLIAGFFAHMTFHRQGAAGFITSRLTRLAIPFVIGWFVLRPSLVSGWIMGAQSMSGEADVGASLMQAFNGLTAPNEQLFVGTHLWFLYYLILAITIVLICRLLVSRCQSADQWLRYHSAQVMSRLCHSPFAIVILAAPTAACLWFMQGWGLDTPDKSLLPDTPVTLIYTGCFLFGWLLHRQPILIAHFARASLGNLLLCALAIALTVFLSTFATQPGHPQHGLLKGAFVISYGVMMWSLIVLTIALCRGLFTGPDRLIRYLADASYWLYLIHLPIVVWLQVAFAELPLHWSVKLFSICTITIAISLACYEAFVRSTFIGALLNGRRKARCLLKIRTTTE